MKAIIIKDLEMNEALDKMAMECVSGGVIILEKKSRDQLVGIVIQNNQLMKQIDEIWVKVEEYVKSSKFVPLLIG